MLLDQLTQVVVEGDGYCSVFRLYDPYVQAVTRRIRVNQQSAAGMRRGVGSNA